MENSKLQFERENIERSWPPLDSTPVGEKTPDTKTPAMDSSARKLKAQKDYFPENPEAVLDFSYSSSSEYDSSDDIYY